MTVPVFGIQFFRSDDENRPVVPSDMSVIGLVLPSDDADASVFPLNTPVNFNSNDTAYLSKIGTGDLYSAVIGINEQLSDFQVAARVVVVRVALGGDIDQTITNIVGNQSAGSGLWALTKAGPLLGVIPRLIGCPGYTGRFQREAANVNVTRAAKFGGNTGNGLMTLAGTPYVDGVQNGVYSVRATGGALAVTSAAAGGNTGNGVITGLSVDAGAKKGAWTATCLTAGVNGGSFVVQDPDDIAVGIATVGAAFNPATGVNLTIGDGATDFVVGDKFTFTVVDAIPVNGGVFDVRDPQGVLLGTTTVGAAFSNQVAFTIADGSTDFIIGDGFDVTVVVTGGTAEANPICALLPAICSQLIAHAVVGGPATTTQDAIDWRETILSDRLIPVDNKTKVLDPDGVERFYDMATRVLGVGVARDYQHNGVPSHSWANEPLVGVLAPQRYDAFSLTDGATDGQVLLSHNIGVIARGELGVETAIAQSGFVFIGTDNAGDDPLWQFYNVTRTRDYIHLALLKSLRKRLGTSNIDPHSVQAIQNDMTYFLSSMKANYDILGFKVGFDKSVNSPEELRLGHLRIFFQAEEPPVLRRLDIDSMRYRPALETLLDTLIVQANTLVA
jgi:phage tail sheath protein FI